MSDTEHVRLFVACEVPDDVKDTIGEVIEGLRQKSGTDVRWIRPEGVHVTLKFLGEVNTKKLPAIKLAIQEAVVGHSPFELEFSTIGTFGGREGLRIMWVGIAGDVLRLEALVRAVNAALAVVGFVPITKIARGTCVDPTRRIEGAALVDFVRRIGNREALLLLVITPVSHRGTTL